MDKTIVKASVLVLGGASPALASSGIAEGFGGVFLWIFCGYCSIIVVAQACAAISSLMGQARKEPEQEAVDSQEA
ncbi:hypothetical protein [Geobacter sp.]|uniref:hypothetical protein n=1 Tax=Geobacter sp. TaxID=46610 RepID=UPI0027B8C823|nr:hypothetical protein [Geobacter sp.]